MAPWLQSYARLDRQIVRLLVAEFFLQLVNSGYFLIFNFFMLKHGYKDGEIATFIGYRFLSVMLISLPLGFYIQGRPLMRIFRLSAMVIPLASLLILWSVPRQFNLGIAAGSILLGLSTCLMQIGFVPFLMRNIACEYQTEAIALHFTTWSTTTFCLGVFSYGINQVLGQTLDEGTILYGVTFIGALGSLLLFFPTREQIPPQRDVGVSMFDFEWKRIFIILAPGLIIAIGAGLTIPFINIFFHHVYGMGYDDFALLGAVSTLIVTAGSVYCPHLLRRYGYSISITGTQSIAVVTLVLLALTEQFKTHPLALFIAILCYLARQPLMNMANPLLSQFTMSYVGPRNREMASALQQALGSGSWFFSSQIFGLMRLRGFSFTAVFLTTALIYTVGVVMYHLLITHQDRQKKKTVAGKQQHAGRS